MKITDPEIIRNGEKDLIDSVQADLDLEAVREILTSRMSAGLLSSRGGQIVVHDNQIAFRLDFDFRASGSLLFDREGNYIPGPEEPAKDEAVSASPGAAGETAAAAVETKTVASAATAEDLLIDDDAPLAEPGSDEAPEALSLDDTLDTDLTGLNAVDDIDVPEFPPEPLDVDLADSPETGLPETDLADADPTDEVLLEADDLPDMDLPDIELPDLNLEDDDDEGGPVEEASGGEDLILDDDDLTDDALADDALTDDNPADGIPDVLTLEDTDDETDLLGTDLEDEDLLQEDMLDDDINDILKESREFWEQKKES